MKQSQTALESKESWLQTPLVPNQVVWANKTLNYPPLGQPFELGFKWG